MEGYIYVIHCTDTTHYKIGMTHNSVESRLQALQTGNPKRLVIAMMFWTPDAKGDERKVHEVCRGCRVRGEWYDLSPQMYCNVILNINPLMVDYVSNYEPARE